MLHLRGTVNRKQIANGLKRVQIMFSLHKQPRVLAETGARRVQKQKRMDKTQPFTSDDNLQKANI